MDKSETYCDGVANKFPLFSLAVSDFAEKTHDDAENSWKLIKYWSDSCLRLRALEWERENTADECRRDDYCGLASKRRRSYPSPLRIIERSTSVDSIKSSNPNVYSPEVPFGFLVLLLPAQLCVVTIGKRVFILSQINTRYPNVFFCVPLRNVLTSRPQGMPVWMIRNVWKKAARENEFVSLRNKLCVLSEKRGCSGNVLVSVVFWSNLAIIDYLF